MSPSLPFAHRELEYRMRTGAALARLPASLLCCLFFLCTPLVGAEIEDGWIDFPSGFGLVGGRIRLELDGRPLSLEFSSRPSWSDQGVYEVEAASDLYFRFQRPVSGENTSGSVTVLSLVAPEEGPLGATVEAIFDGFRSPALVRLKPAGSPDVVFLSVDGSGEPVASAFYDPAGDRSVDFSSVYEGFRLSHEATSRESQRVRFQGVLPRGREAKLFSWAVHDSVFHRSPPRGLPAGELVARRGWFFGWSAPGGSALGQHVEKIFGLGPVPSGTYLEVGDGWQGKTKGLFRQPDRSWLPASTREQEPGEASGQEGSASRSPEISLQLGELGDRGLSTALWLVPHGQSERETFRQNPEAFVRSKTGKAISGRFLGRYVVDGSSPPGVAYLKDLFGQLRRLGCVNFRIGGLRQALDFYERERSNLTQPDAKAADVLAATLLAMREGAGEDAILAGGWDTPAEFAGFLDATRPSLQVGDGVEPLRREGMAARRGYFRHRGACWVECFPVLRWAQSDFEQKRDALDRSRILFAALTGRGLVIDSDALPLPEKTREFLRSAWPPVPVRPMDLFSVEGLPRIWDLKIKDPSAPSPSRPRSVSSRGSDLVGIFNWDTLSSTTVTLAPHDLGLRMKAGDRNLFFDVLEEAFVGVRAGAREFLILPGHARLLSIHRDLGRPQVVAVTGKWLASAVSLADLSWDEGRLVLEGKVLFCESAEDQDELRVHVVCGPLYQVAHAEVRGKSAPYRMTGEHLVLTTRSLGERSVSFRLKFSLEDPSESPPPVRLPPPENLRVSFQASERKPLIEWTGGDGRPGWWRRAGNFIVRRNGVDIGQTTDVSFLDTTAPRGGALEYSVVALDMATGVDGEDVERGEESRAASFSFPAAMDAFLDDWTVLDLPLGERDVSSRGQPVMRRSFLGGPLSVGGKKFARGIGTRTPARLDYRLDGMYEIFEAEVGVDDAARFQGSVVFVVQVDGVESYRSPTVRGGATDPLVVRVPVDERQVLSLIVEDAGDGQETDLAVWGNARVVVGEVNRE